MLYSLVLLSIIEDHEGHLVPSLRRIIRFSQVHPCKFLHQSLW